LVLSNEFQVLLGAMPTRTVVTKQGPMRGLKMDLRPAHVGLGIVDAFLGIPYAGPPIGPLRFMPPTSPQPWTYLREVTDFAPVCPQILPDLNDTQKALEYMTVGRLNYLKNLLRYLHRQSEDCLYLNIYTPSPKTERNDGEKNNLNFKINLESVANIIDFPWELLLYLLKYVINKVTLNFQIHRIVII